MLIRGLAWAMGHDMQEVSPYTVISCVPLPLAFCCLLLAVAMPATPSPEGNDADNDVLMLPLLHTCIPKIAANV